MLSFAILTPTTTPFLTLNVFALLNRLRATSSISENRSVSKCCVHFSTFLLLDMKTLYRFRALPKSDKSRALHPVEKTITLQTNPSSHNDFESNTPWPSTRISFYTSNPPMVHVDFILTSQKSLTKFDTCSGDSR